MWRLLTVILCVTLIAVHVVSLGKITEEEKLIPKGEETSYVITAPILKITTLEFHGLASDYLFLKSLVFIGSTFERKERPRVKTWEWKWLYHLLDASASLDPYFFDPYYFANANLTWDGKLIRETNILLEKGFQYRDWDPVIPFFIGFNYFYFLQENDSASTYLMEASRRPGASPIYASLAAKLAYQSRRTENAIIFLDEILKKTDDETQKKEYEARLETLRDILYLENAVNKYKSKFGRTPTNLKALINKHIISAIPKDPYDGNFYLDSHGEVKSTSDYLMLPNRR